MEMLKVSGSFATGLAEVRISHLYANEWPEAWCFSN